MTNHQINPEQEKKGNIILLILLIILLIILAIPGKAQEIIVNKYDGWSVSFPANPLKFKSPESQKDTIFLSGMVSKYDSGEERFNLYALYPKNIDCVGKKVVITFDGGETDVFVPVFVNKLADDNYNYVEYSNGNHKVNLLKSKVTGVKFEGIAQCVDMKKDRDIFINLLR